MVSGGGLSDLILRCVWFLGFVFGAVPLREISPWLLLALRIRKKGRGARWSPYHIAQD